jgi:hypothetical protein
VVHLGCKDDRGRYSLSKFIFNSDESRDQITYIRPKESFVLDYGEKTYEVTFKFQQNGLKNLYNRSIVERTKKDIYFDSDRG